MSTLVMESGLLDYDYEILNLEAKFQHLHLYGKFITHFLLLEYLPKAIDS